MYWILKIKELSVYRGNFYSLPERLDVENGKVSCLLGYNSSVKPDSTKSTIRTMSNDQSLIVDRLSSKDFSISFPELHGCHHEGLGHRTEYI